MTRLIQLLVGFGVSAVAIVVVLHQVDPSKVGATLAQANPAFLVVVVVSTGAVMVTRALRWQLLFLPERKVPYGPVYGTLTISYLASAFLPFRAGELVRVVFLSERQNLAVPRVLGTVLVEKLFDFLALGVILVVLLATTPLPQAATVAGTSIAAVIFLGFGFVVALAVWRTRMLALLGWMEGLLPARIRRYLPIARLAAQFGEGTDALRVPRLWVGLLGWTFASWVLSFPQIMFSALALGVHLPLSAQAFQILLTSTGQAVPSSPGYVGVYEAASQLALSAFGVPTDQGLAIALVSHVVSYGTVIVLGLISFWQGQYGWKDVTASLGRGRAAPLVAPVAEPRKAMPDSAPQERPHGDSDVLPAPVAVVKVP